MIYLSLSPINFSDPTYVQRTPIGIIGYCSKVNLTTALSDYNSLPDSIKATIPVPTYDTIPDIPVEHKALFPGIDFFFFGTGKVQKQ